MGFDRKIMVKLMRLTDWLLQLPKNLELQLFNVLKQERGGKVSYITSWERIGLEQGLEQGVARGRREALLEVLQMQLEEKFGTLEPSVQQQLQNLSEAQLKSLTTALLWFEAPQDVTDWLKLQS
jgi:hypothetical protein